MAFFNDTSFKTLRQKLRNDPTPSERKLWNELRGKQLEGYKFRRQYGIGRYVVDFYCPKLTLAIEVDGDTHFNTDEALRRDKERQEFIESAGITFLRFISDDVIHNIDSVIDEILKYLPQAPASNNHPRAHRDISA